MRKSKLLVLSLMLMNLLSFGFGLMSHALVVSAEECPHFKANSLLTYSPDGTAFTIGYGDKSTQIYDYSMQGYRITMFGITGPEPLDAGQHYYEKLVVGETKVGYWKMNHPQGRCIHSALANYKISSLDRMGSNNGNCFRYYNAGWLPYCSVCEKMSAKCLFYITEQMARSTAYLPSGTSYSNYFYLCPYDNSLENYVSTNHECIFISANRYRVVYNPNDSRATGNMETEWFLYDNATEYEGVVEAIKTELTACGYSVSGKKFLGWSDRPGGEILFSDGQDWLSVQEKINAGELPDESLVRLYAVWEGEPEPDTEITEIENNDEGILKLEARIIRTLKEKDNRDSFIRGEAGTVEISVYGETDYLTVEFPKEMEGFNVVFDYTDCLEKEKREGVDFSIPIDGIPQETDCFTVKVKAYKDDRLVCCYPVAILIPGQSILDEIRTGLR